MKNVTILLSIFLFLIVAGVGNAGSKKPASADADYILYYDKNGKIKGAELKNKKCTITQGEEEVTQKFLRKKYEEHPNIEALAVDVIRFYGSPDCIVYLGGYPVCICCP